MNRFLTFEGVEGSGKSTQTTHLAEALTEAGYEVITTREPGGTELGRKLRAMLLAADAPAPAAETELLLYLADRAEHLARLVRPALERGAVVLADRFSDSTLAYQAYGRGLDRAQVQRLDAFARGERRPQRAPRQRRQVRRLIRNHKALAAVDADQVVIAGAHLAIDRNMCWDLEALHERRHVALVAGARPRRLPHIEPHAPCGRADDAEDVAQAAAHLHRL